MTVFLGTRVKNVHFVGIGGAGMGPLAEILVTKGYQVSGSDTTENHMTRHLKCLKILIDLTQEVSSLIEQADLVIFSSAISKTHSSLQLAKYFNIPCASRGQILGELMLAYDGIAVAGTHGKTSTLGLISQVMLTANLDPTIAIGGHLKKIGGNARVGNSKLLITEADESDASFLFLQPKIAVVTNIDQDHMHTYKRDFTQLIKAYETFLSPYQHQETREDDIQWAIICTEDCVLKAIQSTLKRQVITYGIHQDAMIFAQNIQQIKEYLYFTVSREKLFQPSLKIKTHLSGKHNVLNILAAIAVGTIFNISKEVMQLAFQNYQGVARRFDILGKISWKDEDIIIIDDYGHHPTEIKSTLDAINSTWLKRRIIVIFEPHRYTRTKDLWFDFITILQTTQVLLLLPIYDAGEVPLDKNINSSTLAKAISRENKAMHVQTTDDQTLAKTLLSLIQPGDILLFQGAGNITHIAHQFFKILQDIHATVS